MYRFIVVTIPIIVLAAIIAIFSYTFGYQTKLIRGLTYFGATREERRVLHKEIAKRSQFIQPFLLILKLLTRGSLNKSPRYKNLAYPPQVCNQTTFAFAENYQPKKNDIFVATQMKCGTTWMQQIVFEVLSRGRGDLSDTGYRHLQAVSPWIESCQGVSVAEAPLIGDSASRIIKTHLPTKLCPYSPQARYIYVARHPVSCFASTYDFQHALTGSLAADKDTALAWFCSDAMHWGPWPDHVAGWWDWAETRENVLFMHYEEMKDDLKGAIGKVAAFLNQSLTEAELDAIEGKCSFEYMRHNEDMFEMAPPSILAGKRTLFKSGARDRHKDILPEQHDQILHHCRERLQGRCYPVAKYYPDIRSG
ncbi:MAG: sulfotransferase domain-containing protein [Chloroflexota bacterium]